MIHEVSRRYLEHEYIHTYGQAETNMSPLFQSWGHKNGALMRWTRGLSIAKSNIRLLEQERIRLVTKCTSARSSMKRIIQRVKQKEQASVDIDLAKQMIKITKLRNR